MSRILVIVEMTIKAGKVGAFFDEVQGAVLAPSNAEEGCLRYELWQSPEDPQQVTFIEEWADAAALEAHLQSAHMQAASARIPEFMDAPPREKRYVLP